MFFEELCDYCTKLLESLFYFPLSVYVQQLLLLSKKISDIKSGSSTPLRIPQKMIDKNYQEEKFRQSVAVTEDYKKAMSKMYDTLT